ncbi:MAG: ATP-binding protein [Myxococcota bacterium]
MEQCSEFPIGAVRLEQRLEQGALSVKEVVLLGRGLFSKLSELHDRGQVHRHLRPANILLSEKGAVECLDQRKEPLGSKQEHATLYESPEQVGLFDEEAGERSDLYSAGVVLYECLAGVPPYRGESLGEVLRQHLASSPQDLASLGLGVPYALSEVVRHLMQKDPRNRYQSARGVLADLDEISVALARGIEQPELVVGLRDRRTILTEAAFVNRRAELEELSDGLTGARRGEGPLVILEAESGGGKTRLLDEVARRSAAKGAWVLRAGGIQQQARQPFELFATLARRLAYQLEAEPSLADTLRARLGEWRGAVCATLPALAKVLGPSFDALDSQESRLGDHGQERRVRALGVLLGSLGTRDRPALVLLDDCQWVDEATLLLLQRWVRPKSAREETEPPRHVLLVAAYRPEEVPQEHPLVELSPAARISLAPLGANDVAMLAESMAGQLPQAAREGVVRLAAGSPFLASAVLEGMVETGALRSGASGWEVDTAAMGDVRSSHRAAVFLSSRIERLSPKARALLTAGAVLGREFTLELAAALADVAPEGALPSFTEARRRHIVWADSTGKGYVFVHDKLREDLLGRLPPSERAHLHRRAAERLEAVDPTRVFDLAYHFDAAGDPERALPYALLAGEQAQRQHALEVAETQYRIAERGAARAEEPTRQLVAEKLGEVQLLRGKYDEAERRLKNARALARSDLDRAKLEGKLGELAFKRSDMPTAVAAIERALHLLGNRVPKRRLTFFAFLLWEAVVQVFHTAFPRLFLARRPLEGAEAELLAIRLYSRLAYAYYFLDTFRATWAHLRELNLAERYPPTLELGQAYSNHCAMMSTLPRPRRALAYGKRGLTIRQSLGDRWGEGQALSFYAWGLIVASRFDEALAAKRQAARLLEQTGDLWEANNSMVDVALCLYRKGELREAVKMSRRVHQVGKDIGEVRAASCSLDPWAKASGGRVPAALIQEQLALRTDDVQTHAQLLQAEGVRLLHAGQPTAAAALFEKAQQRVESAKVRTEEVACIPAWWTTALRIEIENLSGHQLERRAQLLRSAWKVHRLALRMARGFRNNLPHVLREGGLLYALTNEADGARRHLQRSLEVALQQKARLEHAQTLLVRGQLGLQLGWPHAADDLAAARAALHAMGGSWSLGLGGRPADLAQVQPVTLSLADRFSTVLEAGRKIASALSRDDVFTAVRQAALALLRAEECLMLEAPGDVSPEKFQVAAGGAHATFSLTLLAKALESRQPVVYAQDQSNGATEELLRSGARSALCAPIWVREKVAACFYAFHREVSGLFGDEERRLSEFIAALAGAALENAAKTEQLSSVNQKLQAALKVRDDFISVASHELRTPLTTLRLQSQTALRLSQSGRAEASVLPQIAKKLEVAERQIDRLVKLVHNLLDISHLTTGVLRLEPEPTDLIDILRESLSLLPEPSRAHFRLPATRPAVGLWDRFRLEQVVSNLLSNAVKYGADKPVELELSVEPRWVTLTVRDHGIGISPQDLERIFERFERAVPVGHYEGFGLGLYIAKRIVDAMGGTLHAQSEVGLGSTFTLRLPRGVG